MKYGWAINQSKLNRAIQRACQLEQTPPEKRDVRIKELYISYGGLLNKDYVEEVETVITTATAIEELPEPTGTENLIETSEVTTNATTNNEKPNKATRKSRTNPRG